MASLPKRYYALVIEFFDPSNIFYEFIMFDKLVKNQKSHFLPA